MFTINQWRPSATMPVLRQRASLLKQIRHFFENRGYLEVETPCLGRFGVTDVYLSNIKAVFRGQYYNLQTSPEYHMKRLLAAGSGPIFQIARVFRDDELGRWHNPEFSLLEWYQLNIDHHGLMDEVDSLLQILLGVGPMHRQSYQSTFQKICGFDPFATSLAELKSKLQEYDLGNVLSSEETDPDLYLFLLITHVIEPRLRVQTYPVAIYDFPVSQASLSQVYGGRAARFEVYYKGVELANGFHELTDPVVQKARFEQDLTVRQSRGLPLASADLYLLAALQEGLPSCSGVALGVDRLLSLLLETPSITHCIAFDFSRA